MVVDVQGIRQLLHSAFAGELHVHHIGWLRPVLAVHLTIAAVGAAVLTRRMPTSFSSFSAFFMNAGKEIQDHFNFHVHLQRKTYRIRDPSHAIQGIERPHLTQFQA